MSPNENGNNHLELGIINERLNNFMREAIADRAMLHGEIDALRQQTHDWMQAMLNRLPPWAVAVGSAMWMAVGAMAMWIINHK